MPADLSRAETQVGRPLSDPPVEELRRALRTAIAVVGVDSTSAIALRRAMLEISAAPQKAEGGTTCRSDEPLAGPVPRLAARVPEAAASVGVSERTFYGWLRTTDVPRVRINGVTLIPLDLLGKWIAAKA